MHSVWGSEPKQKMVRGAKCYTNIDSTSKLRDNKTKQTAKRKSQKTTRYLLSGLNYKSNKKRSAEATQQIHKDFGDVFNGIGCFESTFSLQQKPDRKPYHALLRCMAYAFQKPFQEELERLQKQDIIAPLGVDETPEWCNSFVLVSKANGKVILYLDLAYLNQGLIRPIHRAPTLNGILLKLNNAKYLPLIDASSGYYNLKLDKKSSYLITFACQLGRYRYKCLPFGAQLQVICSKGKLMKYLMTCQIYLVSLMIFQLQGMKLMAEIMTKQYYRHVDMSAKIK